MNDFDDEPTTIASERRTARPRVAVANDRFYVGTFDRPDDYEVLHQAHRGAEGVVWRACYRGKLPWPVELAIKQLFTSPAASPETDNDHRLVDRWNEQLKLLHLIHHKHLVRYQELFKGWPPHPPHTCKGEPPEELETWYFAMEWIEGSSLHSMIRHGNMTFEHRVRTIYELAQAVEHLHSGEQTAGLALLHRDIKPGNVIVSPGRGAVLVDYGLLRVEEPGLMTEIKSWTDPYLAPEVHLDKRLTSKASDIWAVAATAFFALTEKHPAPNPLETEMMERELEIALRPKVARPHAAVDIVMEALAAGPKQRPTSPTEWASRLASAVGHPAGTGVGATTSGLRAGSSDDTGKYALSGGSSRPVSFPDLAPYPNYIDVEVAERTKGAGNGHGRRPTPPSGELVLRRPPVDLVRLDPLALDTLSEPVSTSQRPDTVPAGLASLLKPVQPARTRLGRRGRGRKPAVLLATLAVLVLVTAVVALWGANLTSRDDSGPGPASRAKSGTSLTTDTTKPGTTASSLPFSSLIDLTNVSSSRYSSDVADVLGTYFSNIDDGNYQAAFAVYSPSEQGTNTYASWVRSLSTTYDTRVIVTSITPSTGSTESSADPSGPVSNISGALSVDVTFRSYQNPNEGPALEGCTLWSLDYTLVPDPGGSLPYLIQLAQDTGAGPQGCYG